MKLQAIAESRPRLLSHVFACALVAIAASCGGSDALAPKDIVGLRFVTQPTSLTAGAQFSVSVELVASGNRRVTAATDVVTLTVAGSTLTGSTSVAAVDGVASFTGLSIAHVGSNMQLSAAARGFTIAGGTLTVTAGAADATQSTVVLSPATLAVNATSSAAFTFKDAFGNPVGGQTVSLSSTLAGVAFTPATGSTNNDGTFASSVRGTAVGTGTISATVGGASITVGSAFTIVPAVAALRFVTQPANVTVGQAFGVSVELIDASGQRVTTATNSVSLSSGGILLAGTTTVTAVAGLATFTGISSNSVATGLLLTATSNGLSVQSTAFNIAAGAPAVATSTLTFPGSVGVGVAITGTFTIKDALGNPVAGAAIALTTSIAGTTFAPASGTTSATGVFTSSITAGAAAAGTITATVSGVALAFPVTPIIALVCTIGAATIGTPVTGSVTTPTGCTLNNHPAATYRFTTPAGPNASMIAITGTGQGTFFPEVSITPDPTPATGVVCCGNSTSTVTNGPHEWLLPPATSFLATVSSSNGATGSFTLSLGNNALGAPGCADGSTLGVRYLPNANATYVGQSLATTDCAFLDNANASYYTDVFLIYDVRPCTISMQAGYGVYIEADDLSGNTVANPVNTANTSGTLSLQACDTSQGPLVLFISSFNSVVTGAYTLQITFTGSGGANTGVGPAAEWMGSASHLMQRLRRQK